MCRFSPTKIDTITAPSLLPRIDASITIDGDERLPVVLGTNRMSGLRAGSSRGRAEDLRTRIPTQSDRSDNLSIPRRDKERVGGASLHGGSAVPQVTRIASSDPGSAAPTRERRPPARRASTERGRFNRSLAIENGATSQAGVRLECRRPGARCAAYFAAWGLTGSQSQRELANVDVATSVADGARDAGVGAKRAGSSRGCRVNNRRCGSTPTANSG